MTDQGWLFTPTVSVAPTAVAPPPRRGRAVPPRALAVCVLASGSGGNSTVVRCGDALILIDMGLGPVTIARRLVQAGVALERISAVCLTHLDQDHFRPHWIPTLLGWRIPVYVHRWHASDLLRVEGGRQMHEAGLLRPFEHQAFTPIDGFEVLPVPLAHDVKGTTGFHVRCGGGRLGYATDLGHVPPTLIDAFAGVDVLAIESNYDPGMQRNSSRPAFLKRRIMGGQGHLCNEQAFEAVCRIADRGGEGRPEHIVLLHRSAQCNDPGIVWRVFAQAPRLAGRVSLAEQRRRSRWFVARSRAATAGQSGLWG